MKNKNKIPLNVALYGMDGRSHKTMIMYLQGPCKGKAVVVDEFDAEIDIIDADFAKAKSILETRKAKTPNRPIIILSLQDVSIEGTIYVKKPIQTADLLEALNEAKAIIQGKKPKKPAAFRQKVSAPESKPQKEKIAPAAEEEQEQAVKKYIDTEEREKTSKHRTAKDLTEASFSAYIGHIEGIDFSDKNQVLLASYNSKHFFMGYVQSALKIARDKERILQLNSSWKPVIIFPHSHEIWLDADDKQLRAFAGLAIKSQGGKSMSLSPVEKSNIKYSEKMENFYDMDAFIWKLAIWTSKGRFPVSLDINRPVYLKRWPNFTRLVVTPHALQIAALLINGPRTLINISDSLRIKPQYVFVFISAAHALGLVGQAERKADEIIAPPEIKKTKPKGRDLLSKILGRLRS